MSPTTSTYDSEISPLRAAGAIALLVVVFSVFAFAPAHDRNKPIAGLACSVLSENEISGVLGAPMQLTPTTGNVCRYISTASYTSPSLIVVARSTQPRTYAFHVVPQTSNDPNAAAQEARLSHLVQKQLAATR